MPNVPPPPAVQVIRARALIADGRASEALAILDGIDWHDTEQPAYSLMLLTRATALHSQGESALVETTVDAVARASATPRLVRDVATAWYMMLRANSGESISEACSALHRLSEEMSGVGLHYFAGVALHNAASGELARANFSRALALSKSAEDQFGRTLERVGILASTIMIQAAARAEMGDIEAGLAMAAKVVADESPTADAIAEASYMAAVTGNVPLAEGLIARFQAGGAPGSKELGSRSQAYFARVAIALAKAEYDQATRMLASLVRLGPTEVDGPARTALAYALVAALAGWPNRNSLASTAIRAADAQGAARWAIRARILGTGLHGDADGFRHSIEHALAESHLAVLESADAIVTFLDLLNPIPDALQVAISKTRPRWLPILRREAVRRDSPAAPNAARVLSEVGTIEDAAILRAHERDRAKFRRRSGLVTHLVRRLSPTVRVHDLGPTSYEIGSRIVNVTDTRRRAASLLFFLVTRPRQSATRELAMEQLWPDQPPRSALNSLHQTLFFLRRDLELWYEDGFTGDYVRMEGELIYLDPEMFQIDSVAFQRQASTILSSRAAGSLGPGILRLYTGTFAPEFQYEPWAEEWRNQVHTTFLRLAQATSEQLMSGGAHSEAADVLARVVEVEPLAFNLRCRLVQALAASGAGDAAQVHYQGLASAYEREVGMPIGAYSRVLEGTVDLEIDN
jgi:DNA-binding SARP family transcriptional activator